MAATGNDDALDPIIAAIHRLIDGMAPDAHEKRLMHEDTLALVLMAMGDAQLGGPMAERSEEHTSELQSLMRISYAVFCLQKTTQTPAEQHTKSRHYHQTTQL